MTFLCRPFYQLDLDQLYALLKLRQEIFVVEQVCAYLDADSLDQDAWHLMGFDEDGTMVAYARLLPKAVVYSDYVAIGRVLTSASLRGKGQGRVLMEEAILQCHKIFGMVPIKVSAQSHLSRFYESLGFEATGETYLEDGIPHMGMVLSKQD